MNIDSPEYPAALERRANALRNKEVQRLARVAVAAAVVGRANLTRWIQAVRGASVSGRPN